MKSNICLIEVSERDDRLEQKGYMFPEHKGRKPQTNC